MKSIPFLTLTLFVFSGCVSLKQHKALKNQYLNINTVLEAKGAEIINLKEQLGKCQNEKELAQTKLTDNGEHLKFAVTNNSNLSDQISVLTNSVKTNSDLLQRTLNELYQKDVMITELENNAKRKDSVNVILVKRVSNSITNKRFRKSLEKIGLVF